AVNVENIRRRGRSRGTPRRSTELPVAIPMDNGASSTDPDLGYADGDSSRRSVSDCRRVKQPDHKNKRKPATPKGQQRAAASGGSLVDESAVESNGRVFIRSPRKLAP